MLISLNFDYIKKQLEENPIKENKKIGLFYGSTTGYGEDIREKIEKLYPKKYFKKFNVEEISNFEYIKDYDYIIFLTSTWGRGEVQSDMYKFMTKLDKNTLRNKRIGIIGLGNQEEYGRTFANSIEYIHNNVREYGNVVGYTKTEGYNFISSKSLINGDFMGLVIDEINQEDKTEERLLSWLLKFFKI